MDKKGSSIFLKNFLISVTVILLAIVLVLLGMSIEKSRNNDKKSDDTNKQKEVDKKDNNKIENNQSVVSYDSLEKLGTIDDNERNSYFMNIEYVSKNGEVIFSYPVINIDSEDVKTVNQKIKDSVLENEKEWLKKKTDTPWSDEEKFITLNDGSGYIDLYFYGYSYFRVVETEDYVSIIESSQDIGHKEDNSIKAVYVIDKNTGKELSKEEIAKTFKYDSYSKLSDTILKDLGYEKYTAELGEVGTVEYSRELESIFITKNNKLGIIFKEEQQSGDYHRRFYEQSSDTDIVEYSF